MNGHQINFKFKSFHQSELSPHLNASIFSPTTTYTAWQGNSEIRGKIEDR